MDESVVEQRIASALAAGEVCDFLPDVEERGEAVEVAASRLRRLLLRVEEVDRREGARLRGLTIAGRLVLAGSLLRFPLEFEDCELQEGVDLRRARLRSLSLQRCKLGDLRADRLRCFGGIDLRGSVLSSLSLRRASVRGSLRLDRCEIVGGEVVTRAAATIREAIGAEGVSVGGEVSLSFLQASATVNFRRSSLRQRFYALGADLDGGADLALRLEEADVERNVDLKFGFVARGGVHMERIRVGGNLDCRGARFEVSAQVADMRDALDAHDARVGGDVMLKPGIDGLGALHRFEAQGRVNLFRARIEGSLECHGAGFVALGYRGWDVKRALDCEELHVTGSALLKVYDPREDSNFRFWEPAKGERQTIRCQTSGVVSFRRARIGRRLSCSGADLNRDRIGLLALLADDAVIERNLDLRLDARCNLPFVAHGTVDLDRITVGGSIDCGGGRFEADSRSFFESSGPTEAPLHQQRSRALALRDSRVAGSLYLCTPKRRDATDLGVGQGWPFHAIGRVSLARSEIGGAVSLRRAHFERRLDYEWAVAEGTPNCLKLNDARIAGYLDLDEARFEGTCDAGEGAREHIPTVSLEARGLDVGGIAWLTPETVAGTTDCRLLLEGASVGKVLNHPRAHWPKAGRLAIDGLRYDKLELWKPDEGRGDDASVWQDWLALQFEAGGDGRRSFVAQPHEQLIATLRSMGLSDEARSLAIDKREREIDALPAWARWLYRWLLGPIGYGHRPWAALKYLATLYLLGVGVFWLGWSTGAIQPAPVDVMVQQHLEGLHPDLYGREAATHQPPVENFPGFSALVYSADTFLPFIDLHQEAYWLPRSQEIVPLEAETPFYLFAPGWLIDNWCRLYLWFHIAAGWVLVTVTIAGLTGIVKTD